MIVIRKLDELEHEFLLDMLYESIHILDNKLPKQELLNSSHIKKYHENWGRRGDKVLVALDKDNQKVGAVWFRMFEENNKGYGYVDNETPELGIAVSKESRGKGVGTLLMNEILRNAAEEGYKSISLSVDPTNNEAVHIYNKIGFKEFGMSGTSITMVYEFRKH